MDYSIVRQEKTCPGWWIEAMIYIRKKPGRIYKSDLINFMNKEHKNESENTLTIDNIVDKLNEYPDGKSQSYVIEHEVTGEIYTKPCIREELDSLLCKYNEYKYIYNNFLYVNNFIVPGDCKRINCQNDNQLFEKYVKVENNCIEIDFSVNEAHSEKFVIENFNLFDLIKKYFPGKIPEIIYIEKLNLNDMIFVGDINISSDISLNHRIVFTNGIQMERIAVRDNLFLQDIILSFDSDRGEDVSGVSFRNSCFFGKIDIRGVTCTNTNLGNKISFEDAKLHQEISIVNSFFGHVSLCFFQTVFEKDNNSSRITVANVSFEDDSLMDFSELYMESGKVNIENIHHLPKANFCFSSILYDDKEICPDIVLCIKNCAIYNTIYISNVSELTFENTQNYSHIIPDKKWIDIDFNFWKKCHDEKQYSNYPGITNKMLLAVYNFNKSKNTPDFSSSKGQEFVMLKENFASLGMYDYEDEAYILYMEYKPILDNLKKRKNSKRNRPKLSSIILYKLLYGIGKYGISPLRVVCSLAVNVIIFTIIYSILYWYILKSTGTYLFSLGNINLEMKSIQGVILGASLYSIANIVPFICQFEPGGVLICFFSIVENLIGCFLIGYFSIALIRRTLR